MAATPILACPPASVIATAVAELSAAAQGDQKRLTALTKAQYDLTMGTQIVVVPGAFLVPSSSRSGLIHRVDHVSGCDCEAGRNGRQCRHKAAIELIEQAQTRAIPMADRIAAARRVAAERAEREMAELFN